MKIGLVGYQASGKSSLFFWLTGTQPDPSLAHASQTATAVVPDDRVGVLCEIYKPKKVTQASLTLVDTPGLSRDHQGSAGKLATIREAGCLVIVVGAYAGADPARDLQSFEEDLLLADMELLSTRIERLRESVKKPRPNRDQELAELHLIEPLLEQLDQGVPLHTLDLTPEQVRAIKSFQLLTQKPRLVIVNIADDALPNDDAIPGYAASVIWVCVPLQLDLEKMSASEREDFCTEMGVQMVDRGPILQKLMDTSGQMLFFTVGEKEVRTWMIPKGATAEDAAGSIHTDLARGFVRAERMNCDDLIRFGSERELKAHNLLSKEPRNYIVQEGDILHILSSI